MGVQAATGVYALFWGPQLAAADICPPPQPTRKVLKKVSAVAWL